MTCNNSDWPAVYKNLRKAWQKWALIAHPLLHTGVPPPVVGLFYKANAQVVLLYGCKTLVITPPMLQVLTGFHHKVARHITNHTAQRQREGTWLYPPIAETLQIAKLYPITEEYVRRRQDTIAIYLATHPVLALFHRVMATHSNDGAQPASSCLF